MLFNWIPRTHLHRYYESSVRLKTCVGIEDIQLNEAYPQMSLFTAFQKSAQRSRVY